MVDKRVFAFFIAGFSALVVVQNYHLNKLLDACAAYHTSQSMLMETVHELLEDAEPETVRAVTEKLKFWEVVSEL